MFSNRDRITISLTLIIMTLSLLVDPVFAQEPTVTPEPVGGVEGSVWHDLNRTGDAEPSAVDMMFSGVIVNLSVIDDRDIQDSQGNVIVSLSAGLYTIDEDQKLVDPQGNIVTDTTSLIASTAPTDTTYIVDENGVLFGDAGQPLGALTQGGFRLSRQTTTDETGNYRFNGLPLDIPYTIAVERVTLPMDKAIFPPTYELDGVLDGLHQVTLTAELPHITDVSFSYVSGDYADLPNIYSTTGHNAPFHAVVSDGTQITLGDHITLESDGRPSWSADSDVDDGVISFPHQGFTPGGTQAFDIAVNGNVPPEGAVLGVWIDWNHDGTFREEEFLAFNVIKGITILPVTAPDDYELNAMAIRFRLFAGDNLPGGSIDWTDFEGAAINGEVEDYVYYGPMSVAFQTASAASNSIDVLLIFSMVALLIVQGAVWRGRIRTTLHSLTKIET